MKALEKLNARGIDFDVVNARFVKPLDLELLRNLGSRFLVTIEDNVLFGGFGQMVDAALTETVVRPSVKNFAYRDEFIPQGDVGNLQKEYGVDCEEIERYIAGLFS